MKRWLFLAGTGIGAVAVTVLVAACATSRARYETAPYTVVKTDHHFEIREYPSLTVVATGMDAGRSERDDRFMRLFRYIDGANATSQKVAMTTPVLMSGAPAENSTVSPPTMAFVVPAAVAAAGAPVPQSPNVTLQSLPARRVAVVRFAGSSTPEMERKKLTELRGWMEGQALSAAGEPFLAYYDPPWTPGPLRRNEVLVPVKK